MDKRAAAAIFLLSFLARIAYLILKETYVDFRGSEMWAVALSIHEGRGFENPYVDDGSPTAIVPPGYPAMLAGIYAVFGSAGVIVQQVLSAAVTSLTFALLPCVSRSLLSSATPGVIGGLIGACFPGFLSIEVWAASEKPYAAFFCLLLLWLFHEKWVLSEPSTRVAVGTGLSSGVAFLFAPHLAPPFAVLTALGLKSRRYLVRALLMAGVILIVLTPWLLRCYRALGAVVPMRSMYGLELRVSNNDLASANHEENLVNGASDRYHPGANPAERERMLALGEPEYARQLKSETVLWISENPLRFAELTAWRTVRFWFFGNQAYKVVFSTLLISAAWFGCYLGWGRRGVVSILCLWIVLPAPYYAIQAESYIYPIYWSVLLMAGLTLARMLSLDVGERVCSPRGSGPEA